MNPHCCLGKVTDINQRIQYLSAEQRLNYLVKIDPDGRLRWARNEQLVDTTPKVWVVVLRSPTLTTLLVLPTPQKWKDAGDGKGIIYADGSEPTRIDPASTKHEITNEAHIDNQNVSLQEPEPLLSNASDNSSVSSALAHHYNTHSKDANIFKRLKERFTTAGMTDRLLRMTVAKNTWLYIAVSVFLGSGIYEPDRRCEGREM